MASTGGVGLSLREQLRLKAQQRLSRQASAPLPSNTAVSFEANDSDSEDDGLPALKLSGRPQRQAVRNAPSSYASDQETRSTKPMLSLPSSSGVSVDSVHKLLREKSRKAARGTDQDGFSRAEAIALDMERQRLLKAGIHNDSPSSGLPSGGQDNVAVLTVRALSPTISSFHWSSQSEESGGEHADSSQFTNLSASTEKATPTAKAHSVVDAISDKSRIAATLLANAADDRDAQATVDLLLEDTLQHTSPRKEANDVGIPFWKQGRTSRPTVNEFCKSPSDDWDEIASSILQAGTIPPSLSFNTEDLRRVLVWTAVTSVLSRNMETVCLCQTLLSCLMLGQIHRSYRDKLLLTIPLAVSDILQLAPTLLHRLGAESEVLETCFPDQLDALEAVCPTVSRSDKKPKRTANGDHTHLTMHLTLVERDDIVGKYCQTLREVLTHASVERCLSLLAGVACSLSVAAASSTSIQLQDQIGRCVQVVFSLPMTESAYLQLQSSVCMRLLSVGTGKPLPLQSRLLSALSGDGIRLHSARRWIAWFLLVQHLTNVQSYSFEPWCLDLSSLERAVDVSDSTSPFYISAVGSSGLQTDYQIVLAATQLLATALHDLPVHMCTFEPDEEATIPAPATAPVTTATSTTATSQRKTALSLAMTPYKFLHPSLDLTRVRTLHRISASLVKIGNRIRDNRGDIVMRTLAKDLLQRTAHSLEYQLHLYHPASARRDYTEP